MQSASCFTETDEAQQTIRTAFAGAEAADAENVKNNRPGLGMALLKQFMEMAFKTRIEEMQACCCSHTHTLPLILANCYMLLCVTALS